MFQRRLYSFQSPITQLLNSSIKSIHSIKSSKTQIQTFESCRNYSRIAFLNRKWSQIPNCEQYYFKNVLNLSQNPRELIIHSRNFQTSHSQFKKRKDEEEEFDADEGENENTSAYFNGSELNEQAVGEVMQKHIGFFKNRLQPISLRTQPSLIEELPVNGELMQSGTQKKLKITGKVKQFGNIIVKNPRLLSVSVFDPQHVSIIDKSIRSSDLGFNPEVKGTHIDVPIPKVTNEVKEKYFKMIKEFSEDAKKRIRSTRHNIMKSIAKEKKSGDKDAAFRSEKSLQNIHDKFIKEVDDLALKKTQEIQKG